MPDPKKPAKKAAKKSAKKTLTMAEARAQMKELDDVLRQVFEVFSGEELTTEDVHALAASLTGPSAHEGLSQAEVDAKDEAQQIAFDAMDAPTAAEARRLAKRALKLDPDCVDALVVMADVDAGTTREMIEALQKAVAAGERSLGADFIRKNRGYFWGLIETRPWMRAMAQLAELLRTQGIAPEAIGIYEKMLDLNPNDNQGVRDPLLGLYLETGNLKAAGALLKRYREDGSASFAWARALERFLAADREGANAALRGARLANRHVELFLTMQKPLPKEMPEMYSPGSEEEAVLCLSFLSGAWAARQDAALWLFGQLEMESARPVPGKAALKKMPPAGKGVQ